MFQFPTFAHLISQVLHVSYVQGCPIRISTDLFVCANPRSFSQLITSFFASESLGIHRLPFFSFRLLTVYPNTGIYHYLLIYSLFSLYYYIPNYVKDLINCKKTAERKYKHYQNIYILKIKTSRKLISPSLYPKEPPKTLKVPKLKPSVRTPPLVCVCKDITFISI